MEPAFPHGIHGSSREAAAWETRGICSPGGSHATTNSAPFPLVALLSGHWRHLSASSPEEALERIFGNVLLGPLALETGSTWHLSDTILNLHQVRGGL